MAPGGRQKDTELTKMSSESGRLCCLLVQEELVIWLLVKHVVSELKVHVNHKQRTQKTKSPEGAGDECPAPGFLDWFRTNLLEG